MEHLPLLAKGILTYVIGMSSFHTHEHLKKISRSFTTTFSQVSLLCLCVGERERERERTFPLPLCVFIPPLFLFSFSPLFFFLSLLCLRKHILWIAFFAGPKDEVLATLSFFLSIFALLFSLKENGYLFVVVLMAFEAGIPPPQYNLTCSSRLEKNSLSRKSKIFGNASCLRRRKPQKKRGCCLVFVLGHILIQTLSPLKS